MNGHVKDLNARNIASHDVKHLVHSKLRMMFTCSMDHINDSQAPEEDGGNVFI